MHTPVAFPGKGVASISRLISRSPSTTTQILATAPKSSSTMILVFSTRAVTTDQGKERDACTHVSKNARVYRMQQCDEYIAM